MDALALGLGLLMLLSGRKRRGAAPAASSSAPAAREPVALSTPSGGTLLSADAIRLGTEDARTDVLTEKEHVPDILSRWGAEIDAADLTTCRESAAANVWRESRGQADPAGGDRTLDEQGIVQLSADEAREARLPLADRKDPAKALKALGTLQRKYLGVLAPGATGADADLIGTLVHSLGPGSLRDLLAATKDTDADSIRARIVAWLGSGEARATARQVKRVSPRKFVRRVVRAVLRTELDSVGE